MTEKAPLPPIMGISAQENHAKWEEFIRQQFQYAAFSDEIQHILSGARPIAFKTWNAYFTAITAPPDRDDLYAKYLLDLVWDILDELNPDLASESVLVELKKLAAKRACWPGFISTRTSQINTGKRQCKVLGVDAENGRKKHSERPSIPTQIADMLVDKLRSYADRIPPKLPNQREFWDYHYIEKSPPAFNLANEEFWTKFAIQVLDAEFGPQEIRRKAQQLHINEFRNNPRVIRAPKGSVNHSFYTEQNNNFSSEEALKSRCQDLERMENRIHEKSPNQPKSPKSTAPWVNEPAPCILANKTIQAYCQQVIVKRDGEKGRGSKNKDHNPLMSAQAVYNQLKEVVIVAVIKRLPATAS